MPTPAARVAQLRESIEHHDHLYYVEARPELSDREYDRLIAERARLKTEHPELASATSPTQRVGGQPIEGFATVRHRLPMLSIDNTYNPRSFENSIAACASCFGENIEYWSS